MKPEVHDIEWNQDQIRSFWDGFGAHEDALYFSRQKGRHLLRLVQDRVEVAGRILDLGCGPGHFMAHLLAAGIPCMGSDLAPSSVATVRERFEGNENFKGAEVCKGITDLPYGSESLDFIFLLETLEHLFPRDVDRCLSHLHGKLARDGHLVLTVPYRENLGKNKVVCLECGGQFHRVQHLQSFSTTSLEEVLGRNRYRTIFCAPVVLIPDWRVYWRAFCRRGRRQILTCPECGRPVTWEKSLAESLASKLDWNKMRHLVCIARKG